MRRRPITKYRPAIEQFEAKQLMSAGMLTRIRWRGSRARQSPSAQAEMRGHKAATRLSRVPRHERVRGD